jgi:hypothetical protein
MYASVGSGAGSAPAWGYSNWGNLLYLQYCLQYIRNNLSKTASKTRVSCVHCASTGARGCVRPAGAVRPLCVQCASAGACVHCAGAMCPLCVRGRSWERVLFVDRRKLSRFAFHKQTVGVGKYFMLTISHYVFIQSLAGEYFPHLAFLASRLAQAGFQNHSRQ